MSVLESESPPGPALEPAVAPVLLLLLPVLEGRASHAAMPLAFSTAGMALAAARLSAMAREEIEMGCMMEKEVMMKKSALFVYPWPAGKSSIVLHGSGFYTIDDGGSGCTIMKLIDFLMKKVLTCCWCRIRRLGYTILLCVWIEVIERR